MAEPIRLRVNLCPACTRTLQYIQSNFGDAAMAEASGDVLARCSICSAQLPPELKASILAKVTQTALKEGVKL